MSASIDQLGYLGFEVSDLAAWEHFTTQVLGMQIAERQEDGGFSLRMDSHKSRFFISPGSSDDLAFMGWQTESNEALDEIVERLKHRKIEVTEGDQELTKSRGVERLFCFKDPAGNPCEIYHGPSIAEQPFTTAKLTSGFVADSLGLGHLVITSRSKEEHEEFYTTALGFKLSDYIQANLGGFEVDITFLHTNPRHHSLAFGGPQKKRIHHFMLQVHSLDDVGRVQDRLIRSGLPLANTLGRHPNDEMISFYAKTPSGFHLEFGCAGLEIDDATWVAKVHDKTSSWGHRPA